MLQEINQQQISDNLAVEAGRPALMHQLPTEVKRYSAWPNRIALTLLITTWLQICAGGLVTTSGAGMAFKDWPTSDGQNMFLYPLFGAAKDKFIEHGHRLFGATVGLIAIGLCIVPWKFDSRRWVRLLTLFALALVIFQGILGGLRVRWDDVRIAKIHGCVAPLFLGLVVAIAVVTARGWRTERAGTIPMGRRLRRLALFTLAMAYGQLVLGAQLRHVSVMSTGGTFQTAIFFHLFLAVALSVEVFLFWWQSERHCKRHATLRRPPRILLALLALQVFLGCGTWVLKYAWPGGLFSETAGLAGWTNTAGGPLQAFVVTAHVATGSLILGASVWAAVLFFRATSLVAQHEFKSDDGHAVTAWGAT